MARKKKELKQALKYFADDSKSVEAKLVRWLGGFNLFEILGISRAEIRHSRFLAWMMDPNGIHEMGGRFLLAANPVNREKGYDFLKDLDLDCSSIKVDREYSNSDFDKKVRIDIRVIIHNQQRGETVVVIENKIGAGERETEENGEEFKKGQLKDYVELTEVEFSPESKKVFVFLTPDGRKPEDANDGTVWGVLSYVDVAQCLMSIQEELKNRSIGIFREKVLFLVDNYIQCLRRHVVKDPELIRTCKELYARHHRAIDCITSTLKGEEDRCVNAARDTINSALHDIDTRPDSTLIHCVGDDANGKHPTFQTSTMNAYIPSMPDGKKGSWGKNSSVYFYWFDIKYKSGLIGVRMCLEFGGKGLAEGNNVFKRIGALYKEITGEEFALVWKSGKKKGKPHIYHQTWDWKIQSGLCFDLDTESGLGDLRKWVKDAVITAQRKELALLSSMKEKMPDLF